MWSRWPQEGYGGKNGHRGISILQMKSVVLITGK